MREKAAYSSAWWLVGVKSARFAFFLLSRRAQCRARELGCKILFFCVSAKEGMGSGKTARRHSEKRKKENRQPKGGMGGRHAATTQGV